MSLSWSPLRMVVFDGPGDEARGLGVRVPLFADADHAAQVAQDLDEALAVVPVDRAQLAAEPRAPGMGVLLAARGAGGEERAAQRR